MLVEMDTLPFKVGTVLNCQIQFSETNIQAEKIRSIKHYDRFYRTPPNTKKTISKNDESSQGASSVVQPKKLCEFHFVKILDSTRLAIQKYIYAQKNSVERKK